VLNAFRHQRKGHHRPPLGRHRHLDRAQRLSASEERAPITATPSRKETRCAQRLSASEERTLSLRAVAPVWESRCSTPFGIRGKDTKGRSTCCHTLYPVLNAFRHQRKGHEIWTIDGPRPAQCSTPFGIRGKDTIQTVGVCQVNDAVLNAFRHQRKGHVS